LGRWVVRVLENWGFRLSARCDVYCPIVVEERRMDGKTLEQRLVTKDSVLAASSSLSRAAAKLAGIGASMNNAVVVEQFLREMMLLRLETERSLRVHENHNQHLEEVERLKATIAEQSANTRADIVALTERLQQEKKIRAHRIDCEAFALKVNQHKSVSYLKRKIVETQDNQRDTQKKLELIDSDILTRKTQFDSLLMALLDLESQIIQTRGVEDESDDEGRDRGERVDDDEAIVVSDENDEGEDGEGANDTEEQGASTTVDESKDEDNDLQTE
jgi:hypothetical protein